MAQAEKPRSKGKAAKQPKDVFIGVVDNGQVVISKTELQPETEYEYATKIPAGHSYAVAISEDGRPTLKEKKLKSKAASSQHKAAPAKEGYVVVSVFGDGKVSVQERELKRLPRRGRIPIAQIRHAVKKVASEASDSRITKESAF